MDNGRGRASERCSMDRMITSEHSRRVHYARVVRLIECLRPPTGGAPRRTQPPPLPAAPTAKTIQTNGPVTCSPIDNHQRDPCSSCALEIFSTSPYFHRMYLDGCGGARGGRGRAARRRVARPLASPFSTPLSRSVGRPASLSATLVFFVYFLFLFV